MSAKSSLEKSLLLGIDMGTASVKAAAVDTQFGIAAEAAAAYDLRDYVMSRFRSELNRESEQ